MQAAQSSYIDLLKYKNFYMLYQWSMAFIQGQVGWYIEQSGLVKDSLATAEGIGTQWTLRSRLIQTILWFDDFKNWCQIFQQIDNLSHSRFTNIKQTACQKTHSFRGQSSEPQMQMVLSSSSTWSIANTQEQNSKSENCIGIDSLNTGKEENFCSF